MPHAQALLLFFRKGYMLFNETPTKGTAMQNSHPTIFDHLVLPSKEEYLESIKPVIEIPSTILSY